MTITARYPGTCTVCGRPIGVGDQIEWTRGEKPRHTKCSAAVAQVPAGSAIPASIRISQGSGYGNQPYEVGQIVRQRESGTVLTVLRATQHYIREDGLSFGVGADHGYIYRAECRLATSDEVATFEAREKSARKKAEAYEFLRALVARPTEYGGIYVEGEHSPEGETLMFPGFGDQLYGGGAWVIVTDDSLWIVRNNGHDGDNWSRNNVRTGGAGAIGYKAPRTLEQRIRDAIALVS